MINVISPHVSWQPVHELYAALQFRKVEDDFSHTWPQSEVHTRSNKINAHNISIIFFSKINQK